LAAQLDELKVPCLADEAPVFYIALNKKDNSITDELIADPNTISYNLIRHKSSSGKLAKGSVTKQEAEDDHEYSDGKLLPSIRLVGQSPILCIC